MDEVQQLKADVTKELTVMKEIGMRVPKKAFDRAQSDSEIEEWLMEQCLLVKLLIYLFLFREVLWNRRQYEIFYENH